MPTSLLTVVSCWYLPPMLLHGYSVVLLRQADYDKTLYRDRLQRLELPNDKWRSPTLRGAYLLTPVPPGSVWLLRCSRCIVLFLWVFLFVVFLCGLCCVSCVF